MELIRLMPNDAGLWRMYADFEARVISFGQRAGLDFNDVLLRQQLKQRFVNTPEAAGYFLIVEDLDHAETPIAHICSWLAETGTGRESLYIHVYQAEADAHIGIGEVIPIWVKALDDWAASLNYRYASVGSTARVGKAQFWTQRDPAVFSRYCRGHHVNAPIVSHVLEWDLPAITKPENVLDEKEYSQFAKGA